MCVFQLELKQQLSGQEKSLQETQKAINHWNEKLGDLRLNEIEEWAYASLRIQPITDVPLRNQGR